MAQKSTDADVLIVGGGAVGLALAVALKQATKNGLRVELWDPMLGRRPPRQRVSAIAAGPRRMLTSLGVWRDLEQTAQAIHRMEITNSKLKDAVRPLFLEFQGELGPGEPFAHMVCNADLEEALERRAIALGAILAKEAASDFALDAGAALTTAANGRSVRSTLAVGADGAHSLLREAARIDCVAWRYDAKAIVCTISHEHDHDGRAIQHFLPEGPFALLPLVGRRSSIVWTMPVRQANFIESLSPEEFHMELDRRVGSEFGDVRLLDEPLSFYIGLSLARRLAAGRIAIVGDAAHSIHPLAGQGLNLGLRDAAALAEVIVDTCRLGLDPGERTPLRRYERMRRFDNLAMALAADVLFRLFSVDGPVRLTRDFGLGATNHVGAVKSAMIKEAGALAISPPRLLLGERL